MHLAPILTVALALAGSTTEATVAPCEKAMIGHGSAGWRSESLAAGPVGVRRRPLRAMTQTSRGLVTKMPMLIEGREPETVRVSVPPALRQRVFIYYGDASSFAQDRGHSEIEFELCGNKPRTIWPGGIRVKGKAPVRLDVFTEDGSKPCVLRLGRPQVYQPN